MVKGLAVNCRPLFSTRCVCYLWFSCPLMLTGQTACGHLYSPVRVVLLMDGWI